MSKSVQVYDPRGTVEANPVSVAPRVRKLEGLRLAILDNTKWNASKLLRAVRERLYAGHTFSVVNYYRKESFSKNAAPELLAEIAGENDIVVTAIGD